MLTSNFSSLSSKLVSSSKLRRKFGLSFKQWTVPWSVVEMEMTMSMMVILTLLSPTRMMGSDALKTTVFRIAFEADTTNCLWSFICISHGWDQCNAMKEITKKSILAARKWKWPADRSVLVRWEIEHGHSSVSRHGGEHRAGDVAKDHHQYNQYHYE